ncbi:unnamed protein product [Caenorhabditis brenneri]
MERPSNIPGETSIILNDFQMGRLRRILKDFEMQSKNFGGKILTIHSLVWFFGEIIAGFRRKRIPVTHVYLVGGAASFIANGHNLYNDIDVVFKIGGGNVPDERVEKKILDSVKDVVFNVLRYVMRKAKLHHFNDALRDSFIAKKSLVFDANSQDSWSLIAFNNVKGDNLEIKTSIRMRREFQFASDSLQIDLMPMINRTAGPVRMISSFGNVHQTLTILKEKRIETWNPEEIIGGGLYKYCLLKSTGFKDPKNPMSRKQLHQ